MARSFENEQTFASQLNHRAKSKVSLNINSLQSRGVLARNDDFVPAEAL